MNKFIACLTGLVCLAASLGYADPSYVGDPLHEGDVIGAVSAADATFDELTATTANVTTETTANSTATNLTVTGGLVLSGDTVDVSEGGTGASSLTDHAFLLGSGTGAITASSAATDGQVPIGSTGADPVLSTLTGTANEIAISNAPGSITIGIPDPLIVSKGGTGAASLTNGGILLGSGTGAITALGVASNGQIPIGDGTTDPQLGTISAGEGIDVTNGAGSITVSGENASTSNKGVVELATNAEALAGTDTATAVTPAALNYVMQRAASFLSYGVSWNQTTDTCTRTGSLANLSVGSSGDRTNS